MADDFASAAEISRVLARDGHEVPPADLGIRWDRSIAAYSGDLPMDSDPVLAAVATRIDAVLGFGCSVDAPTFRFHRYAPCNFHPGHVDCYEIAGDQLVVTALVYLTDAQGVCEKSFPRALPRPRTVCMPNRIPLRQLARCKVSAASRWC